MMYSCVAPPRNVAYRWSMVCASSSRRAETTFFSCLGSTFGMRAICCSPRADVIQKFRVLLLQLCRRRSEWICSTTWAVATPGAHGAGRLPSRSERGRYRPKIFRPFRPFLVSVSDYLRSFLRHLAASSGNLANKPNQIPSSSPLPSRRLPLTLVPFSMGIFGNYCAHAAYSLKDRKSESSGDRKSVGRIHRWLHPSRFPLNALVDRETLLTTHHTKTSET